MWCDLEDIFFERDDAITGCREDLTFNMYAYIIMPGTSKLQRHQLTRSESQVQETRNGEMRYSRKFRMPPVELRRHDI